MYGLVPHALHALFPHPAGSLQGEEPFQPGGRLSLGLRGASVGRSRDCLHVSLQLAAGFSAVS